MPGDVLGVDSYEYPVPRHRHTTADARELVTVETAVTDTYIAGI